MKVECISKFGRDLPAELIRPEVGYKSDSEFSLIVGKQYVVYGLTVEAGHIWFYICDEDYTYYPVWKPSALFKVVDGRLSAHWQFGLFDLPNRKMPILAFREWVEDPLFYDHLTDGQPEAVRTFIRNKEVLDAEYK